MYDIHRCCVQDLGIAPEENLILHGPAFIQADGSPIPASARRKLMRSKSERQSFIFSPDFVYTFHFWQHLLDCAKYEVDLVNTFDLTKYLNGQPLQVMGLNSRTGRYLWNLHMCHESLLNKNTT